MTPKKTTLVNIYNFIRMSHQEPSEFLEADFDTIARQIRLLKQYGLPSTFALKYDALMEPRYQGLLKENTDANDEIAAGPRQIGLLPAIHAVAERHNGRWYVNTPRRVFLHRGPFRRRHAIAMPVIHAALAGVGRADGLQSGPAAIAWVQQAAALQRRQRGIIQIISFLLRIRPG